MIRVYLESLRHVKRIISFLSIFIILFCIGVGNSYAQLPQNYNYQVELRNYLNSLSENDFHVELEELYIDDSFFKDEEEIYKTWLVWGEDSSEFPPHEGLRVDPSHFTLDAIESGGQVNMTIGRGGWISALGTAFFAEWDYEGNPHYDSKSVKLRAFVAASVDMMMQDQAHGEGDGDRSDFLGGQLIQWAYAYGVAKDALPESAKVAFEEGLIRMFEKLESWGPTGIHADMDTRAIPAVLYLARHVESQDLTQRAYDYIDRVLDNHFNPAGYVDHGGAYDASYNGISFFHLNWGAYLSEYPPIVEAVKQMTKLKAHLTLPDPDGRSNTPHHSNSSSAGNAAPDQWTRHFRNAGLAYWSDDGIALLGAENIVDPSTMTDDLEKRAQSWINDPDRQGFASSSDSEPGEWRRRHWTVTDFTYPALDYKDGHYERLRSVTERDLKFPFERDEMFIESFDDKFLSARQKGYGTVLFNDRLSWWTSEGKTEELNGFGGGNISAFWTPTTGTVLMGVGRGTRHGGHDLQDWIEWPVHALSGKTTAGAEFSSALQRHPEGLYELGNEMPTVTVSGELSNEWSDPKGGISGQANYQRVFRLGEEELYVTTSVDGDSGTDVEKLYEILPVFGRNASNQSSDTQTQIAFEVDGSWEPAGTDMKTVTRIRLQRFEGTVIIEFASPARVKLSPQDFYINPSSKSGSQIRNILIDLLGSGGSGTPLDQQSIEYRIYNPDVADNNDWQNEPDTDTTSPEVSISHSPSDPDDTDEITFSASASDDSGISKIEVYVNESLEKTCEESASCEVTGGPYASGDVTYQAIAYDAAAEPNKTESSLKTASVSNSEEPDTTSPEISISHSPSDPDDTDEITFSASASDDSGISKIEMYVNESLEKTCEESASCEVTEGPYASGDVTYQAIAYDADGEANKTESKTETVSVSQEEQAVNNRWPTIDTPELTKDVNSLHVETSKVQDEDGDSVYTNIDWRVNGESISLINYSFDVEGSVAKDSLAKDFTSYGNHGKQKTRSYIPAWTPKGKKAGAYYFDGEGDHIYTPTSEKTESLKTFTIGFWMKHDDWGEEWATLVSKPFYNDKWEDPWSVFKIGRDGPRDQLNFQITVADGKAVSIQSKSDIPSDEWIHVAGTYDGKMLKLYINGELDKQIQVNEPLVYGKKTGLYLGSKWGKESEKEAYRGLLDEFRLFDRALTPRQIERHYSTKYTNISLDEVSDGEEWTALVTPTDTKAYGESKESNALVIEDTGNSESLEFTLNQNYPNPFQSETNIEYTLPDEEVEVSLIIYNTVGRKIATLVDSEPQSGVQQILFNASDYNLSSGIYFYRLKAGDDLFLKKMTYIK